MEQKLSFLHAADLHLDSLFSGLAHVPEHIFSDIKESSFLAFDQLIRVAIDKEVDFILLVGDLFDNKKQNLKAQIKLRKAFLELETHDIDVYLSYGNHDYMNGNMHSITYPKNVHIFSSEVVQSIPYYKNGKNIANIYGFSYVERAMYENKALEYMYENKKVPFHIAMLHGSIKNNTEHDVYAPFQIRDLVETPFDYWALGHIHKREVLKHDPPIVYPGNLQGRNRKETGEKGFYHVELQGVSSELSFIPVETLQFNTIEVNIGDAKELHEIEISIQTKLLEKQYEKPQLLTLHLTSTTDYLTFVKQEGLLEELVELMNESFINQDIWFYIIKVTISTKPIFNKEEIIKGDHFIGELVRNFEKKSIQSFVKPLYNHRQGRKYLEPLTNEEGDYIKTEAEQFLLHELIRTPGETYED